MRSLALSITRRKRLQSHKCDGPATINYTTQVVRITVLTGVLRAQNPRREASSPKILGYDSTCLIILIIISSFAAKND